MIMPQGMFTEKANAAIKKNFKQVDEKATIVKRRAVKLLDELNLCRLANAVRNEKGLMLQAFFNVKTHKPEMPFRTIVSEKNSWPHLVSGFLQKQLEALRLMDPFLLPSSSQDLGYLRNNEKKAYGAFSIEVVDFIIRSLTALCCKVLKNASRRTMMRLRFVTTAVYLSKVSWNC